MLSLPMMVQVQGPQTLPKLVVHARPGLEELVPRLSVHGLQEQSMEQESSAS